MSLFSEADKKATTSSSKNTEKKVILINDPKFDKNMIKFAELKAQMDSLEAQMNLVKDELFPIGMEIFQKEYESNGAYPESFNISTKSGATAMWIPTDKYKKLTPETFEFLDTKYGCVESKMEYSLDTELVQKYGNEISEAIEKSTKIPTDVKLKLIKAKKTMNVQKGTITKALTVGKGKNPKKPVSISEFMSDIEPVCYFKDPRKG